MYRVSVLAVALVMVPGTTSAQGDQSTSPSTATQTTQAVAAAAASKNESPLSNIPTRRNVQVELTIADQRGDGPSEKKQVSMIVSEMHWGKIRTHATTQPPSPTAGPNMDVALNVDARPFITSAGHVQLELVVNYNPLDKTNKVGLVRPTELNQSMTVVLQSGKPLVVAQAADPMVDRKMIVEVVATILK
jgi:hypothetical protein